MKRQLLIPALAVLALGGCAMYGEPAYTYGYAPDYYGSPYYGAPYTGYYDAPNVVVFPAATIGGYWYDDNRRYDGHRWRDGDRQRDGDRRRDGRYWRDRDQAQPDANAGRSPSAYGQSWQQPPDNERYDARRDQERPEPGAVNQGR